MLHSLQQKYEYELMQSPDFIGFCIIHFLDAGVRNDEYAHQSDKGRNDGRYIFFTEVMNDIMNGRIEDVT
jgi:hypothetical protein